MGSRIEVIYLRRSDTMATVAELLASASPGAQVWLVAPWRMGLLRNLINLKLLRRSAEAAALDLRLVSAHLETRALAREAGVPVYAFVPIRLRRYRRARRSDARGLAARVVPVEGPIGRRWARRPRPLGVGTVLLSFLVILSLVGALLGVALSLVPSATVSLEPKARPVAERFGLKADPTYREVDVRGGAIPARIVQVIVSGRGETPTSGGLDVPDAHAVGEVVFVNRTSNPVRVPKGTVVRTGAGTTVRFYTVSDVELPGVLYGQARMGITAVEPGPSGNVRPLTINVVEGEIAHLVEVLNDAPTTGGSIKRTPVVAYQDVDRLRAEMLSRLQGEAYQQFVAELEEGEFVPPASLEAQLMSEHFDQVIDQQSDVLSMEAKVVVRGVAIDVHALRQFAIAFLEERLEEGFRVIDSSLDVQYAPDIRIDGTTAYLQVTARAFAAPAIDEEEIKRHIRGRTIPQAIEWLSESLDLVAPPQISVSPSQWEYVPWLPGRIEVVIVARGG